MLTKSKIALVAAVLLGSASGAFAQSYDPDLGSGNTVGRFVQPTVQDVMHGVLGAYAQVPAIRGNSGSLTANEKALFDRIRPE